MPPGLYLISTTKSLRNLRFNTKVSMPSRAYTSFLQSPPKRYRFRLTSGVNALSGLYLISTGSKLLTRNYMPKVSMPSRAYTSFLRLSELNSKLARYSGVNALSGLYLISTSICFYVRNIVTCVNALSGLYLISTVPLQKPRFYAVSRACFCRYLSEYSDNSSFSCMLTFWTYLMRYTYP